MKMLLYFIVFYITSTGVETSILEKSFQAGGKDVFLKSVQNLKESIGEEKAAESLIALIKNRDKNLAAVAVQTLGAMKKPGRDVIAQLVNALETSNINLQSLKDTPPGDIPLWLAEELLVAEDTLRNSAGELLTTRFDLQKEKRLLPLFVQIVSTARPDNRNSSQYWAIAALGKMQSEAVSSWSSLREIVKQEPLTDENRNEGISWNKIRGMAIYSLAEIQTEREKTLQALKGLSNDSSQDIRNWAAIGIALLAEKPQSGQTAEKMLELTKSSNREIVAVALHTLGNMVPPGKSLLSPLAKTMAHGDIPVEYEEQYDLGDIPLWFSEALLQPENEASSDVRHVLSSYSCKDDKNEEAILRNLIGGLHDKNGEVRLTAIRALGKMEEHAAIAQPFLNDILSKEPEANVAVIDRAKGYEMRAAAAYAMGEIGVDLDRTSEILLKMIQHPDREIWSSSAQGLALLCIKNQDRTPPLLQNALPALIRQLENDNFDPVPYDTTGPHQPAVKSLAAIGEPAIPALIETFKSNTVLLRKRSVEALFWMPKEKAAIEALLKAASEDDASEVRCLAIRGLRFPPIGFPKYNPLIIPVLITLAADRDPDVRMEAARTLGTIKSDNKKPSKALIDLLKDSKAEVRLAALIALQSLPPHRDALPAVENLLNDKNSKVRENAKKLLDYLNSIGSKKSDTPENEDSK